MPPEPRPNQHFYLMPLLFNVFLVLAALLAIQSLYSLFEGFRFSRFVRLSRTAPRPNFEPQAAVIVPVKGLDDQFQTHVEQLLAQDYPGYGLIFTLAEQADPAYSFLADRLRTFRAARGWGPRRVEVVVAGLTHERGEKVNNLLAALRAVPPDNRVLVFADADASFKRDWLRSLIGPLSDPAVTVSTGFRWYLPGRTFASRLRAAWDASIATTFGDHRRNLAWGGSMAVRADDFRRLKVAECYWAGSVSDDYGLYRAVRENAGWIRFEPRCLLASSEETTLSQFLNWSNRQVIITRVYAPHLWLQGLLSYSFFCATLLLGLGLGLLSGPTPRRLSALGLDAVILLLGLGKARLRESVAIRVFPEQGRSLRRLGASYWLFWPFVPWVMLFNLVTAALTRKIEWRGTCYHLVSPTTLRVLSRRRQPSASPARNSVAPGS